MPLRGSMKEGVQHHIDSFLKIEDSDLFIGILWKKFGTAGNDGKIGTEHEFYKTYEAWEKIADLKSCCISTKINILLQCQKKHNNLHLF